MPDEDFEARIQYLEHDNARLRRLLGERGVPGTLRHQTRNTLALIRSILRHSTPSSASVEDYAAHVEGRLDALLRVQTRSIAELDRGVDLDKIIADEFTAHVIREDENVTMEGPPVRLEPRVAEMVALAIHELTVNAIKFGAMTTPSGRIAVSWSVSQVPALLLFDWSESGLSLGSALPEASGFGLQTLEKMLPYQFGAQTRLEFRPQGLHCTIKLPLGEAGQRHSA